MGNLIMNQLLVLSVFAAAVFSSAVFAQEQNPEQEDSEYKKCSQPSTFDEAQAICENWGGFLMHIADKDEQKILQEVIGLDMDPFWIGLHDKHKEGNWVWTNGKPVTYSFWEKGQPNDQQKVISRSETGQLTKERVDEDCTAAWMPKRTWWDFPCNFKAGFICERPLTDNKSESGKEWTCQNTMRVDDYIVSFEPKGWSEAQNQCARWSGNLVSIHNEEESSKLKSVIQDQSSFWIGLSTKVPSRDQRSHYAEGTKSKALWEWTDNTAFVFSDWAPNQPGIHHPDVEASKIEEDCVAIFGTDQQWHDAPCRLRFKFICKKSDKPNPAKKADGYSLVGAILLLVLGCVIPAGFVTFYMCMKHRHEGPKSNKPSTVEEESEPPTDNESRQRTAAAAAKIQEIALTSEQKDGSEGFNTIEDEKSDGLEAVQLDNRV